MEKIQKVIILVLIFAIIFSIVSVVVNFSLLNFDVEIPKVTQNPSSGTPSGNVKLIVEANPSSG